MKLLEKKISIMEGNFSNLDNEINENKKEIIQIKKNNNDSKAKNYSISVNNEVTDEYNLFAIVFPID